MDIPLQNKLKKRAHQQVAYAQDLIMEEVYSFFPIAVFHGGTALWRCYQGKRFSEDIDMYLPSRDNIDAFFSHLAKKGFRVVKKRIKKNSLYSLLLWQRTEVRFEALFAKPQKKDIILKEYETVDRNFLSVYTLTPSALLHEKIAACCKRKLVRDLYDVYFLLYYIERQHIPELRSVLDVSIIDEDNLKALIITGLVPTVTAMKRAIQQWEK
jgi:predicted nucleotidyltransferase component of viral defense system